MTRESTSISKISRPRITGIYPRKRLFRLMDAGLDYPVTWISAPAGSGKTTFIASYLDTHKLPFLWYQADASDADIATFFYYMGMAAKKAVPRKRPLPLLTSEYLPNISTFIRRYFETLYGRLPQPFFIIFDNYQDVPADASFHDMIVQGLDIIPDGIHVVVISRADPPHHFARLCANNRCNIIGWDEIRCTLDEFKEITRMKMPKKLTNEKVDLLYARMEGWVAGLVLMMEHAKSGYFDGALPAELTHGRVFDYFANEIFEKAGEETRIFLLKTAFLPMITVQMAEKLTGIHTSGHILSRLIRENYFTVAHPQPEVAYQYHSLFREYLVTKASDTFDTEELNNVKISAAIILEESGQIEDAASLFCKAKEWDGLMQLILKHAESLILQGRSKTLEEWISSVPEDIREVTPWLLFWFGVCRFLYNNPAAGRTYFDKAFKHFHVQGDVTGAWLAWTYAVDTFFHEFENFSSLDAYIRVFEDLIQKNSVFPSSEVESRVIFCRFISMMLRQPDHPEIKIWAKRVFSLLQKCSNMNLRLQCGFYLTVYYVWIGDFTNAGILVDILCKQVHLQTAPPLIRLLGKAAMIFYEWNTGSTGLCLQHISEVIEYTYRTGVHVWNLHLLSSGACAALNDGDIKTAIRLLEQIEPNLPTARKIDICFYHHIIAVKDLIMGNLISASEHVQMEVRMHSEINAPFPMAIGKITMSQIYAAMGKYPEAVMQLALARQIGNWMKSKHIEYMCLLTEAYFALELGIKGVDELHNAETNKHLPFSPTHDECKESDGESQLFRSPFAKVYGGYGLEILRKAMTLGREQNFISCFLWRFDIMPRLCVKALEAGIEVAYVRNLIRKRNLVPDVPPLEIDDWPWPLRVFTLGQFSLQKDEKPLISSGKVQKRPLEMLKALIALGGKDVREEQLNDILWPEAEGDVAHISFETTLHRLRQMVGNVLAIQCQEGRLSLDPRYWWVDAWAFERIVEEVDTLWKSHRLDEAERTQRSLNHSTGLKPWPPLTKGDSGGRFPSDKVDFHEDGFASSIRQAQGRINSSYTSLAEKAMGIYKGHFLQTDAAYSWAVTYREVLRSKFHRLVIGLGRYWEEAGNYGKALEVLKEGACGG